MEEIEKTPVPEVFENNNPAYEDTPYIVSPPESHYGTLEHDRKPHFDKQRKQENGGFGFPNAMNSSFIQDHNSLLKQHGMPNLMPGMFEASFPELPNMFDQPFVQPQMFGTSFPSLVPNNNIQTPPAPPAKPSGERIIPIQVVRSNSAELAPQKPKVYID